MAFFVWWWVFDDYLAQLFSMPELGSIPWLIVFFMSLALEGQLFTPSCNCRNT